MKGTLLSQLAVSKKAHDLGIKAPRTEVEAFLIHPLLRHGLVNSLNPSSLSTNQNVQAFLAGQGLTYDDLLETGTTLVEWAKIVTRGVDVTADEVKHYISLHPSVFVVPERVMLSLESLNRKDASSKGAVLPAYAEATMLFADQQTKSAVERRLSRVGSLTNWSRINLYVDLKHADPNLARALSGKQTGDRFGPVQLTSGTFVHGRLAEIAPEVNFFEGNPDACLAYAALLTRLEKANQQGVFTNLVADYLGSASPAIKGVFDNVLSWVGAGLGSLLGGGARYDEFGASLGRMLGGWVDRKIWTDSPTPEFDPAQLAGVVWKDSARFERAVNRSREESAWSYLPEIYEDVRPRVEKRFRRRLPAWNPSDSQSSWNGSYGNITRQNPMMMGWQPPFFTPLPPTFYMGY